jgi:S-adenosylmethionine hydrolase
MAKRLVGLLTDFGGGSGYPGQMKARLLSLAPDALVVDVSHEVPPYGIAAGALLLEEAAPAFPPGSVLLAVVDPGVGTARRGLVVEGGPLAPGRLFVGPDNGLLARVAAGGRAWALPPPPPEAAPTFHGRDVFAPAAARLANGEDPATLGVPCGKLVPSPLVRPIRAGGVVRGETLLSDRFGNLITSIERADLPPPPFTVRLGRRSLRFVRTFGEARSGTAVAWIGSGGRLELGVVEGSLVERLGRSPLGRAVEVRPAPIARARRGGTDPGA